MIKVTLNKEKEIAVSDLNDSHFIGLQYISGVRATVLKVDDRTYVNCANNKNNSFGSKVKYRSIADLLGSNSIEVVYVFGTGKELFTWIANQEV